MDPASVAERWGASLAPDHVHVVTVPRQRGDADELWHRFAAACDLTATTGRPRPGSGRRQRVAGSDRGRAAAARQRADRPPIEGNREQAKWLRDTLAHGVLARLGSEPIQITDDQLDRRPAAGRQVGPSRRQGRLRRTRRARRPGSEPRWRPFAGATSTDAELLDTALDTIVQLLLMVRERSQSGDCGRGRRRRRPAAPSRPGDGARTSAPYLRHRAEPPASAGSPSSSRSSQPTAPCTCASPRCRTSSPSCCSRWATATPRSPARR